jgi:prepilin signal peptidase PulO-like enzyme (type II secretory pathway)
VIVVLLSMLGFAASAALGLLAARALCAGIASFPDGPQPGNPRTAAVVLVTALLGAVAASRGLGPAPLAIFAVVCGVLAAIWYADIVRGIVPDLFTLAPLGAIAVAAVLAHRFDIVLSTLIPTIPFVVLAALTRGRGLGWGDVKLAALGGALLGMQNAVLAFALASLAAVVITRVRSGHSGPIAFAPYLVVAIAVPLALQAG